MTLIPFPVPVFFDTNGEALEDGYVYIGESGMDARANPVAVFYDVDLTIPAAQPIRTLNGYPAYQGAPSRLWIAETECSVTVLDRYQRNILVNAPIASGDESNPMVNSLAALTDPGADRILFWDESDNNLQWLQLGSNLSFSGTTLNVTIPSTGWTLIGTSTPTGVATVTFSAIPTTYSELLLTIDGISHNNGSSRSPQLELSPDGAAFGTPAVIGASQSAASLFFGGVHIPGYLKAAGVLTPYAEFIAANGIGNTANIRAWRCAGISAIRLSWNGAGNFDAGTFNLYGR
jgi:hypothetical protein